MEEDKPLNLNIRDIALRDSFTLSEQLCFGLIFLLFITFSWVLYPNSPMLLGFVFVITLASMANFKIHEVVHPFIIDRIWTKVFCLLLPPISILFLFFINNHYFKLTSIFSDNTVYYTLDRNLSFTGQYAGSHEIWIPFSALVFLFCLSTQLFLIPKSLYFINKLLRWCTLNVLLILSVGFIYTSLNLQAPPFTKELDAYQFFAHFAYDGFWGAFAILWMFTAYGLAIVEYEKSDLDFLQSKAPLYLMVSMALATTTVAIKSDVSAGFLALSYAIICVKQIRFFKLKDEAIFKNLKKYSYSALSFSLLYGCYRLIESFLNYSQIEAHKLTSYHLFQDNPIFGWGYNAFQTLAPYYSNAQILDTKFEMAPTGLLAILTELGILGTLLIFSYALYFYLRYHFLERDNTFSNNLITGLFILVLLSFFENPFFSIPVLFSFWILFFSAFRWADLIHKQSDEVDTNLNLVISDTSRKVPIVTNPKKDRFK